MLILERKEGEKIVIRPFESIPPDMTVADLFADGSIEIVITEVFYGRAKVGIEAPAALVICREEVTTEVLRAED